MHALNYIPLVTVLAFGSSFVNMLDVGLWGKHSPTGRKTHTHMHISLLTIIYIYTEKLNMYKLT